MLLRSSGSWPGWMVTRAPPVDSSAAACFPCLPSAACRMSRNCFTSVRHDSAHRRVEARRHEVDRCALLCALANGRSQHLRLSDPSKKHRVGQCRTAARLPDLRAQVVELCACGCSSAGVQLCCRGGRLTEVRVKSDIAHLGARAAGKMGAGKGDEVRRHSSFANPEKGVPNF